MGCVLAISSFLWLGTPALLEGLSTEFSQFSLSLPLARDSTALSWESASIRPALRLERSPKKEGAVAYFVSLRARAEAVAFARTSFVWRANT